MKTVLAAAAALGLTIGVTPTAIAQPKNVAPHVVVMPSEDLPEVADVTVAISGFEPHAAVFVQQCAQVAPGVSGCDFHRTESVDLDDAGAALTRLSVRRMFEAYNENGDLVGAVDCAQIKLEPGCFIAVGNVQGGAEAPLFFKGDE
ncbi:hypothetical protein FNH05_20210 [Amycolatopsis rhizosphaerae]|uniref:Uncharacterized protein n=1 Tax=Amycolatopsis rhizosphaerae TaxID=2053003 RepID=A0A558CB89_9PSEU|nr:hypothetical protein FNH05_20210 [Amycolatopsis rhizosphaerae]